MRSFYGLVVVLLAVAAVSCIESWFGRAASYDEQMLNIQTVSLFNQRLPSRLAKKNWKGDWIFRRDRLDLIDTQLRATRPDLIVMQETLTKEESPFESDRSILQAGALADYNWRDFLEMNFEETQEQQLQAFASSSALTIATEAQENERHYWAMGADGFLSTVDFEFDGQPLVVFNVQMPPQSDGEYLWYNFIQQRVRERLAKLKTCAKRVVIAGLMPGDQSSRHFNNFIETLQLKDTATGFCQIAANCFTATPTNDLYMATAGDESPSRLDRIFVHQSAIVYTSNRNFEGSDAGNRYVKEYGLSKLWPTQRFGWSASTRLARCREDEL